MPKTANKSIVFDHEEMTVILEIARIALGDACIYDEVANEMDISDGYLHDLREKIIKSLS